MDRIESLINKLKQQFDQGADLAVLRGTVQLLHFELNSHRQDERQKSLGTAKVAVILPSSFSSLADVETSFPEYQKYAPKPEKIAAPISEKKGDLLADEFTVIPEIKSEQADKAYDPMIDIPTLSHQPRPAEINQTAEKNESLNEKLKQGKIELMEVLRETPVKDLRKAIGINDRFLFITDLFRGDESMYERSIKTINSFNIYAEAEYWISRELKTKLGWDKENTTVQQFDQVVRRRFS